MIDVALTPAQLRDCDVAVVIDVLRATTTITWALGAGYEEVHCVASLHDARALAGADRVLAGERNCLAPPGFDQGNSPRDAALVAARELILASTNGTPAILAATGSAPLVIVASLINLEAVARAVTEAAAAGLVQIVCAGSEGAVALEDVYLAGRLSRRLGGERTDGARTAEALARRYPDPASALRSGAHATRLREAGLESDIADCALESELTVVGTVCAVSERAAVVCAGDRGQPSGRNGVRARARHAAAVILASGGWCVLESCLDVPTQRWEAELLIFDLSPDEVADVVWAEASAHPGRDLRLTGCDRSTLSSEARFGVHLCHLAEPFTDGLRAAV